MCNEKRNTVNTDAQSEKSENRFRKALDCMQIPVFMHDRDFRLIYVNPAYLAAANTVEKNALGELYWKVFPQQEKPFDACFNATTSAACCASEDEIPVGDKTYKSIGFAQRDENNNFVSGIHYLQDITEEKSLLSTLSESVRRATSLFELTPDAIMTLDEKGFLDCNPATLKIFQCSSKEEFIGHHPSFFSPKTQPNGEDSFSLANEKIEQTLTSGSNSFEWLHCTRDGTNFDAEVTLVAFSMDGKLRIQATVRDVSQRKEAERKVIATLNALKRAVENIVKAVSKTMGLKDQYTTLHQKRVADISASIGKKMGWDEGRIEVLKLAALVHDLGKVGIPTELLTKPSRLTPIEERLVREHVEMGYQILKDFDLPWDIAEMVRQHHERLDGSGYPRGLKGDEILPEAKVIAVADTIEAMATSRPYRPAVGLQAALEELRKGSGKRYDAQIVNTAIELLNGEPSLENSALLGASEI